MTECCLLHLLLYSEIMHPAPRSACLLLPAPTAYVPACAPLLDLCNAPCSLPTPFIPLHSPISSAHDPLSPLRFLDLPPSCTSPSGLSPAQSHGLHHTTFTIITAPSSPHRTPCPLRSPPSGLCLA